jgi:hypothetical protein
MIRNAFFLTAIICLALGLFLMQECAFLIPYRRLLWERWTNVLMGFSAAFLLNTFAAVYMTCRKVFLKDTGQKLAHLEKQLRTGSSISQELADRLRSQ